jgi:hypothetical protein
VNSYHYEWSNVFCGKLILIYTSMFKCDFLSKYLSLLNKISIRCFVPVKTLHKENYLFCLNRCFIHSNLENNEYLYTNRLANETKFVIGKYYM